MGGVSVFPENVPPFFANLLGFNDFNNSATSSGGGGFLQLISIPSGTFITEDSFFVFSDFLIDFLLGDKMFLGDLDFFLNCVSDKSSTLGLEATGTSGTPTISTCLILGDSFDSGVTEELTFCFCFLFVIELEIGWKENAFHLLGF